MKQLIAIVDDEEDIVELVSLHLKKNNYSTLEFNDAKSFMASLKNKAPDLIILDLMLPDMDGVEICKKLKLEKEYKNIPIIMLTAKQDEVDKVIGLEIGADDYITKPFSPRELVARVKALLRRSDRGEKLTSSPIHIGDLTVDPGSREVTIAGAAVDLRTQEFELLLTMIEHKRQVLSREKLLQLAWGYDFAGQTRTVDVHVGQLRKKLVGSCVRIETVTGVGYKLVAD